MVGDMVMEDTVMDMDTEAMVITTMDTAVTTMITTTTTTITGELLLRARVWSPDHKVLLTLCHTDSGIKDPPLLSQFSDCLVAITTITTPCTTDTATTTGDPLGIL